MNECESGKEGVVGAVSSGRVFELVEKNVNAKQGLRMQWRG